MKLWIWFISGAFAGLLGASLLGSVEAVEPPAESPGIHDQAVPLRILRGSNFDLGHFQLRENPDGRWDLFQDLNRCEITETEAGPESYCTQIAPVHFVLRVSSKVETESELRITFKSEGPQPTFTVVLIQDMRPQAPRTSLELSGVLPGTYGLFEGAASIELQ